ncbi:MAG: UDP-N-acetyl-D-mannosamine dehydrogenase [Oceanospirillaceae bacterium]|nr:UDP-N-acetyl-D-mannosamine dehydrogenase [Oceanospirillaceae bacterium]
MRLFKTISVIGLGYIGLPTATMFASRKINVHGVDVNQQTVDTINAGGIHIVEPDLDMVVKAAVKEGYLRASLEAMPADAFLIAVPTPFKNDHEPDLSYIQSAAEKIAPVLQQGNLVILESTSPVGATEQLAEWLSSARPDLSFPHQVGESADINVAHCPERVLPGQVMRELVENDRIIGGMTARCSARCIELYSTFVRGACVQTDARTAEMAKLTENSFRDVNIAFANELSILCDQFKIDVWELINLANRHPRVNILQPGTGVGGHCIAVDPWFIVHAGGENARIIRSAREINDYKTEWVVEKVQTAAAEFEDKNKRRPVVACMGLAFKPNIDDLRESPALEVFHALLQSGLDVLAVEPNLESHSSIVLTDPKRGAAEADIVAFLVAHKGFAELKVNGLQLDFCGVRRDGTDQ